MHSVLLALCLAFVFCLPPTQLILKSDFSFSSSKFLQNRFPSHRPVPPPLAEGHQQSPRSPAAGRRERRFSLQRGFLLYFPRFVLFRIPPSVLPVMCISLSHALSHALDLALLRGWSRFTRGRAPGIFLLFFPGSFLVIVTLHYCPLSR